MKELKSNQDKFPYRCVHYSAFSVPPATVKSSLPVLVLIIPPLLHKTGSLHAGQYDGIVFNKEHLCAATYRCNMKQNFRL
jgi:hypothetical protein